MLFRTVLASSIVAATLLAFGCGLSPEGSNPQGVAGSGATGLGGASTGASSANGAGGSGGNGSGQAGNGGSTPENCINGVDDDGDGLVDCDDTTDCADYLCTSMPVGDYVVLGDAQGGCPAGYKPDAVYDCTKCACGASCRFAVDLYDNGQNCADPPAKSLVFDPTAGLCYDIDPDLSTQSNGVSFKATPVPASDQCIADTKGTHKPICRPEGVGSCAGGTKTCVPIPVLNEMGCVVTTATCAAPFATETKVYEGANDAACGCSCGGASNCSAWTITQYKDQDNCGGHSHPGKCDGSCGASNDATFMSFSMAQVANTCAGGSSPAGTAKRLCCGLTP